MISMVLLQTLILLRFVQMKRRVAVHQKQGEHTTIGYFISHSSPFPLSFPLYSNPNNGVLIYDWDSCVKDSRLGPVSRCVIRGGKDQ